jgi:hypothetical protein
VGSGNLYRGSLYTLVPVEYGGDVISIIDDKIYCKDCASVIDPTIGAPVFDYWRRRTVNRRKFIFGNEYILFKVWTICVDRCSKVCTGVTQSGTHYTPYFSMIDKEASRTICNNCIYAHSKTQNRQKIVPSDLQKMKIQDLRKYASSIGCYRRASTKDKLIGFIVDFIDEFNELYDHVITCPNKHIIRI